MKLKPYKLVGGNGTGYKYEYIETESEETITIKAKAVFRKDSKRAMNFLNKTNEENVLALYKLFKGIERKNIKE